jgi:hypothetical protein
MQTDAQVCYLTLFFCREGGLDGWDWGLNSGLDACKAGAHKADTLPLEPHFPDHFSLVILEMGCQELFAEAGLKPQSSQFQPPK